MAKAAGKFILNSEKALEVTEKAIAMLRSKQYPFNKEDTLPDTVLPEGIIYGSLEHSRLIFYACSADSMRKATHVYRAFRDISREVHLGNLCCLSKEELSDLVSRHLDENGIGEPAEALYYNSRILHEKYGDDPRRIKQQGIDETLKILEKEFEQVGLGKASLIMKNFVRFGFWDFDKCQIPVKVDRHITRISLGTGVVETGEQELKAGQLVKPLSNLYRKITSERRISAIELDDALWAIGAYLCTKNDEAYCKMTCPLHCERRPKSDSMASMFELRKDMRKPMSTGLLFDF